MVVGRATAAITTNNGKVGPSYDGVDDTTSMGIRGLDDTTDGLTGVSMSLWVKMHSFTGNHPFLFVKILHTGLVAFGLDLVDNTTNYRIRIGARSVKTDGYQSLTPSDTFNFGEWVHFTGVIDYPNNTISVYANGSLVETKAVTFDNDVLTLQTPTYADHFGSGNMSTVFAKWVISDVILFEKALSADEVLKAFGNQTLPSIIHRWKLNTDYTDSVGGVDATNSGSRIGNFDGAIAEELKSMIQTENDKILGVAMVGGQMVTVVVEEAP